MGKLMLGAMLQIELAPPLKISDNTELASPPVAVSDMVGKNAARAAPIFALADFKSCSADNTSGRTNNTSDDTPAGTSVTKLSLPP